MNFPNMGMLETRTCRICGKDFSIPTKKTKSANKLKGVRGKNCVTCSTKCSEKYTRLDYSKKKKYRKDALDKQGESNE